MGRGKNTQGLFMQFGGRTHTNYAKSVTPWRPSTRECARTQAHAGADTCNSACRMSQTHIHTHAHTHAHTQIADSKLIQMHSLYLCVLPAALLLWMRLSALQIKERLLELYKYNQCPAAVEGGTKGKYKRKDKRSEKSFPCKRDKSRFGSMSCFRQHNKLLLCNQ